jgi:hypothetical protein
MNVEKTTPQYNEFTTLGLFAVRVGVTLAAVTNWRSRHSKDFPAPVPRDQVAGDLDSVELQRAYAKGRLYRTEDLVDWARRNGRLATRPVDASLSPLNAIAAALGGRPGATEGFMRSSASEELRQQAGRALALAALQILEVVRPDLDPSKVPELAPAVSIQLERGRSDEAAAALTAALKELEVQAARDLTGTIDAVRSDFAILSDRRTSAELSELAAVAAAAAGSLRLVVDPCCGTGDLLVLVARATGTATRLVGRDLDPLRLAAAAALLLAEGFRFNGTLGEPDDPDWVDGFDQASDSTTLPFLAVTLPRSSAKDGPLSPTPRSSDWWLQLLGERLTGTAGTAVVPIKSLWLEGRRLKPVAAHLDLVNSGRRTMVIDPPVAAMVGSAYVVLADRENAPVLLASCRQDEPDTFNEHVQELLGLSLDTPLPDFVEAVGPEELSSRGSLVPRVGQHEPPGRLASFEPSSPEPRRGRPPRPRQRFDAAPTRGRPRSEPADNERLPTVPLAALQSLREATEAHGDRSTTPTAVYIEPSVARLRDRTDLVQLVRGSDVPPPRKSRHVVLITSPARFGEVSIEFGFSLGSQDHRRGVHVFALSGAARQSGISEEFLAAWLSSARVQGALRASVALDAERLTASAADVENLPADFPDPETCIEIAARWREVERVEEFARRLPAGLKLWKLHLLDDVRTPPTED